MVDHPENEEGGLAKQKVLYNQPKATISMGNTTRYGQIWDWLFQYLYLGEGS